MSRRERTLFVIGMVSLTLSTRVGAQQYGSDPIKNSFEDFAGHYAQLLLAAFDSIPAAKYDFKPTPPQQSVGYIAQHLENANYNLCERIGGMKRAMTARDSQPESVKAAWPKDTLIARLRTSLYFCRDAFAKIDDPKMGDPVRLGPSGSTLTQPRVHALLFFVTDLAEHYAQIASYMRLMGMTPPSALPRPKS
ncbi:MAG TPA: DinB family protein [Gemmatimonadaceae bacterium]|jgi:uncharacterized damage-inducible protein DinB|nr:DinB family protein [Gemmatimonadaceae bacterium]